MQLTGSVGASAIADVCGRVYYEEKWPLQWKGKSASRPLKGKGDAQECDASRRLLLAAHMGKVPAAILKNSAIHVTTYTLLHHSCSRHGQSHR